MNLIQLHNGAWIDPVEVESVVPVRATTGLGSAHTLITMRSGCTVELYPYNGHESWSDRRDLMPEAIKEAEALAKTINVARQQHG